VPKALMDGNAAENKFQKNYLIIQINKGEFSGSDCFRESA
jgi:hypothetical protein